MDTTNNELATLIDGQYTFTHLQSGVRIHGGTMQAKQDSQHNRLVQPYIAFILLLEGNVRFQLDGRTYDVESGHSGRAIMVALDKIALFSRYLYRQERVCKVTIAGLEQWVTQPSSNLYAQTVRQWSLEPRLRQLATSILCEKTSDSLKKDLHAINLLNACWQTYGSDLGAQSNHNNQNQRTSTEDENFTQQLEKAMQTGAFEVQHLSKSLNVSVRTLQRKIQQHYACSAHKWLQNARMQRALDALGQELSIGETAYLCGYRHPSNFIQAFRRHFGVTPGALIKHSAPASA